MSASRRQRRRPPSGNYVDKVLQLARDFPPPIGVTMVEIVHDDDCGIFRDRPCDCDPSVRFENPGSVPSRN